MKMYVAKMHKCPLLADSPQKSFSSSSPRAGIRYSLVCFLPAEEKPAQHNAHTVASTCGSSSNSSNVYVSPVSVAPPAPTAAIKLDAPYVAKGAARPVSPAESALHAAASTTAVVCAHPRPLLARCASFASSWTVAKASRYVSRTNNIENPTPKAGCSRSLAGLCRTGWGSFYGTSGEPLRMAAAAAWTATFATAAVLPTPRRAVSIRACKTAALLLSPLFLSVCCRETYAATTVAPFFTRSQSAILPAVTIAALSLSSSPPPADFRKQSGSLAAPVQPQCARQQRCWEDGSNTDNKDQSCRSEGLLQILRRRSNYMSFPLENLAPFSSWTAAMVGPGSVCSRKQRDGEKKVVAARFCSSPSVSPSSSRGCSSPGRIPGGEGCEGFLCPLSIQKSGLPSAWGVGDSYIAECGPDAGYAACRSMATPLLRSTATQSRSFFALASSVTPVGGVEVEAKKGEDALTAEQDDHFYARFQQPRHPAFDLMWQEALPEMQLHVAYYVHRKTGTRLMSLAAAPQEKEKVFCVSFRTPVSDSTGVPHILEHSVLSGSKKYPLKEPFAELLKGSLYSFLNAYTYAEHTTYPVASVNTKDFFNLASVYFDAVFQPRVQHDIDVFRQEGWRIEASLLESGNGTPEGKNTATISKQQEAQEGELVNTKEDESGVERGNVASSEVADSAEARKASAIDTRASDELQLTKRVKLSYQGVVLNEMKGVYSQPSWLLYRLRMKTIFPSISAYAQDSGGNPEVIPLLTYEHFKNFFKRYYSLSNARIFFYGSDDIRRRLDFIDKNISELDEIPRRNDLSDLTSRIREQPAFKEPVRVRQPYPATTAEMEDYVTVTWVLDPATQQGTEGASVASGSSEVAKILSKQVSATSRLALTVLDHLLMGTSAAPLYKALASSQLGKEVIGGGLSEYKHFTFSAGLKGIPQQQNNVSAGESAANGATAGISVSQNAVERVEKIVLGTLEKCAREGFEADAVDAAMNTVEFRLREFNTGSFPKGLAIILQIISDWMVDREPLASLRFDEPLQDLKKRIEAGEPIFQRLIQELFLDNPHRATVHLVADATLEKEIQQKDEEKIEQLRERLTDEDVIELVANTQELKAKQLAPDPPEALATIPTLELSDVEEEEEIPTEAYSLANGSTQVLLHHLPTAGILYADVALPLHNLDLEELQFLSLFARMLTQAGTSHMDEAGLANYIGKHTGGVQASVDIRTVAKNPLHVPDPYDSLGFLVVSGKAVKTKVSELFDVIALVLCDADFSNSARGIEILKEIEASTEDSFINSGVLAALRIGANLTAAGFVAEQRGGISYAVFIRHQLQQAKQDWEPIQEKLEGIREKLLSVAKQERARTSTTEDVMTFINLTGDSETLRRATSVDYQGGRMLRQLAKALTAPLPNGLWATGASICNSAESQTEKGHELSIEKHVDTRAFLKGQCDAVDLEPLERIENIHGGVRIVSACDWARALQQDEDSLKKWATAAEGFVVPTQVNYVYLGGRMLSPGERFYGHLSVVAEALSKNYVWDRVRVVGGAYGGSFSVDFSGTYIFRSYRDPQLLDTLSRYLEAAEGLEEFTNSLDERGLTRAILAVLRGLNQPLSNDQKGYTAFWRHVAGETKEHRDQYRNEVMKTTPRHFREFATRLQKLLQVRTSEGLQRSSCISSESMVAVVGSDKAFEDARASGDALFARDKGEKGAPFTEAPCPLRFRLLDVKKATTTTTTGTVGMEDVPVSQ